MDLMTSADIALEDAKTIIDIAKPFIEPFIKTLITPKAELLKKWLKNRNLENNNNDLIEEKFREYLTRSYKSFSTLNVLVFPNQQINIKSIYLPLTIYSSKEDKRFTIDVFKPDYIKPYRKILISDTAGMGKSTLTKWIAISLIEQKVSIPVIVELKNLKKEYTLLDDITKQIDKIDHSFDKELITKLLETGQFTILLDGFDEIEYEHRESVIRDLKDFMNKVGENWFILTSRPDSSLTAFGDFQIFNIVALTKKESFKLLQMYDALNSIKVSKQLIKDIREKNNQVYEFLHNPFLVSLLYKTYTYNKDIPSKKSSFYDEVYSALYKHHDLSKDGFKRNKKSNLDLQDFRLILRRLAWDSAKIPKVDYTE